MAVLLIHRWVGSRDGGAETHIDLVVAALREAGHRIDVITREGTRVDRFPSDVQVHTVTPNLGESDHSYTDWRVYPHTLLFMMKVMLVLAGLCLRGWRYDVVSTHFATEAIVAWLLKIVMGVPYVHVLEGYTPLEARWAKKATAAIAISEHNARQCEQAHGFRPAVINIGLSDASLDNLRRQDAGVRPDDCQVALMVARLDHRKGVDVLVRAMSDVKEAGACLRAVVAGEGIERASLEALIDELELEQQVDLIGAVDDNELQRLYAQAAMFVLPSRYEGFGIVLIEAMAAGLPIVTTSVGAIPDVVGDAARVVAPEDAHACAQAMLALHGDPESARELGEKAWDRVNERFRWSDLGPCYVATYARAACRSP